MINSVFFKLLHPDLVNGSVFINACSTKCGWIEWGYQKVIYSKIDF